MRALYTHILLHTDCLFNFMTTSKGNFQYTHHTSHIRRLKPRLVSHLLRFTQPGNSQDRILIKDCEIPNLVRFLFFFFLFKFCQCTSWLKEQRQNRQIPVFNDFTASSMHSYFFSTSKIFVKLRAHDRHTEIYRGYVTWPKSHSQ